MASVCKACKASIRWVKTHTGKNMPIDLAPDPRGRVQIVEGGAVVLRLLQSPDPNLPRFTAHWTTCPETAAFRKPKESGGAEPAADGSAVAAGAPAHETAPPPRQGDLFGGKR